MLASYKFKEVTFRRHDPLGKLKEHLQQVGFIWSYSDEDLLLGGLSKQQVLVKSQIPTPDQMIKINKEAVIQKSKEKKNKDAIERRNIIRVEDEEESSSSSSMSMDNLNSDKEDSNVPSHRSPTLILQDAPLPMHLEEVHSSPITKKVTFEKHSLIQ